MAVKKRCVSMGERVLTVLEEIENLTAYGVEPEVVERIEEKYIAEREDTFLCVEAKIMELEKKAEMQDTMIKVLVEYIQSKGL